MPNEQHQPPSSEPCRLTPSQETRIDFARRDLDGIRSQDLNQIPPHGLVLAVATLTRRLDDTLSVIAELRGGTLPGDPAGSTHRHP